MSEGDDFLEPPWDAPLDIEGILGRIPAGETIKGMFLQPMLKAAQAKGLVLPGARDRYLPFHDYPLTEHAALLAESAKLIYPDRSIRQGLRRLGHHAQGALVESTIGRVIWSAADDVGSAFVAMAKGYAVAHPMSEVSVHDQTRHSVKVRLDRIWWFLDSHHVGCFEGVMKSAGVTGTVRVKLSTWSSGEFLCSW